MQVQKDKDGFFLLIERDEPVMKSLSDFVLKHEIPSAVITGLGAVKNARIGYYHLEEKKYSEETLKDDHELLNITGNATWMDGKPIIHCHVSLGDTEFRSRGGHLFEADVAVVVEIYLTVKETKVVRAFDSCIGLNIQRLS